MKPLNLAEQIRRLAREEVEAALANLPGIVTDLVAKALAQQFGVESDEQPVPATVPVQRRKRTPEELKAARRIASRKHADKKKAERAAAQSDPTPRLWVSEAPQPAPRRVSAQPLAQTVEDISFDA